METSLASSSENFISPQTLTLEDSKSLEMSTKSSLTNNTTGIALPLTDSLVTSSDSTPVSMTSRSASNYSNNFLTDRSEVTKYVDIDNLENVYACNNNEHTNTKTEEGIASYNRNNRESSSRNNNSNELLNGQTNSVILEAAKVLNEWEKNREKPDYFKFESQNNNDNSNSSNSNSQSYLSSYCDGSEGSSYQTSITLTNNSSSIPLLSENNNSQPFSAIENDSASLTNINSYQFDHTFEPSSVAIPLEPLDLSNRHELNKDDESYLDDVDLSARSYHDEPKNNYSEINTKPSVKTSAQAIRKNSVDKLRSTTNNTVSTYPAEAPVVNKTRRLSKTLKPTPPANSNRTSNAPPTLSKVTETHNPNHITSFKIEHEMYYIFDYIYYNSLLKTLSSFSLTLREVIILLDSVNFPLNSIFYKLSQTNFHFQYEELQLELDKSNDMISHYNLEEVFSLPINHPISLTTTLIDIIKMKNLIFSSSYYINNMNNYLNEKNSIIIINNLLNLIRNNYYKIRNLVFFHCFNKGYDEYISFLENKDDSFHLEKLYKRRFSRLITVTSAAPNALSSGGIRGVRELKNKSSQGNREKEEDDDELHDNNENSQSIRPRYFSSNYLLFLLNLLDIKINPSKDINGSILLSISLEELENNYSIKKSLLKSRFIIIQLTLKVVDILWDFGIRPYDLFSKIKTNYSLFSLKNLIFSISYNASNNLSNSNVLKNFKKKSTSGGTTSLDLMNLEDDNEEDEIVATFEEIDKNNLLTKDETIKKKASKIILISSDKLFLNYLPYYRTYGWNFPLATLTQLCDNIGGLTGKLVKKVNENEEKKEDNFVWVQLDLKKNKYLESFLASLLPNLSDILVSSSSSSSQMITSESNSTSNSARFNDFSSTSSFGSLSQLQNNIHNFSFSSLPSPNISYSTLPSANSSSSSIVSSSSPTSFFYVKVVKNSIISFNFLNKLKKKEMLNSNININHHLNTSNLAQEDDEEEKKKINILNLLEDKITLGRKVRIIDNKIILARLLSKYEWWDRPTSEVLEMIVGKEGEIISLADFKTKRRVGLRIFLSSTISNNSTSSNGLNKKVKEEIIYDALPVEALIYYNDDDKEISIIPPQPAPTSTIPVPPMPPTAPPSSSIHLKNSNINSSNNKKEKKLKKTKSGKKIKKKSEEKLKKKKMSSEKKSQEINDSSDNFSISSSSSSDIDDEDLEKNVKEILNQTNKLSLNVPIPSQNDGSNPPLSTDNSVPFPFLKESPKKEESLDSAKMHDEREKKEKINFQKSNEPAPSVRRVSPIRIIDISKKKNYSWLKPLDHVLDDINLPEEKAQLKVQEANLNIEPQDYCVGMNPNTPHINTNRHSSPSSVTKKIKSKLNESKVPLSTSPIRGVAPIDSHINCISETVFKDHQLPSNTTRPVSRESTTRGSSPNSLRNNKNNKENNLILEDVEEDKEATLMKFDLVYEGDSPQQPIYPYSNTAKTISSTQRDNKENTNIVSQNIKKYSTRPSSSSSTKKNENILGIFDENFQNPSPTTSKQSSSVPSSSTSKNKVKNPSTLKKKDDGIDIIDPKEKERKLLKREEKRNKIEINKKQSYLEKQLKNLSK